MSEQDQIPYHQRYINIHGEPIGSDPRKPWQYLHRIPEFKASALFTALSIPALGLHRPLEIALVCTGAAIGLITMNLSCKKAFKKAAQQLDLMDHSLTVIDTHPDENVPPTSPDNMLDAEILRDKAFNDRNRQATIAFFFAGIATGLYAAGSETQIKNDTILAADAFFNFVRLVPRELLTFGLGVLINYGAYKIADPICRYYRFDHVVQEKWVILEEPPAKEEKTDAELAPIPIK